MDIFWSVFHLFFGLNGKIKEGDFVMTKIIAHRGSKGTHPENTLSAFKEACIVQSDGIELDVQLTKDNHLIVMHDEEVNRTTNGSGLIKELTLAELKELDAGAWFSKCFTGERVPTLVEVLTLLEDLEYTGLLNIELKTDKFAYYGIEDFVLETIANRFEKGAIMLSSFNSETIDRLSENNQSYPKALIMGQSQAKINLALSESKYEGFHPSMAWVEAHLDLAKQSPKSVRPWTVNSEAELLTCFKLQLAGCHTDFPERALKLRERGN